VRDVRVHDGRHTAATLLIEYGVDVRVVMAALGHSDLRVTMRYAHASNPLLSDAAARMGQGLWGGNGPRAGPRLLRAVLRRNDKGAR